MKPLIVAPQVEDDLRQIRHYLIQEAGYRTAERIQGKLLKAFEGLAELPGKGHARSDLTPQPVLFFGLYQ